MTTNAERLHDFPVSRGGCPVHPAAEYSRWRAEDDGLSRIKLWNGTPTWLITSAQHAQTLLMDRRMSSDRTHESYPLEAPTHAGGPTAKSFRSMDGEEHTMHRRFLAREFSAPRIAAMEPLIQEAIADLIARMKQAGPPANLFTDFALPLPMRVVCAHIGVPLEDQQQFDHWVNALLRRDGDADEAAKAGTEMVEYIYALIDARTDDPREDVISHVANGPLARGEITRQDAMSTCFILFLGGYESTAFSLSTGMLALLQNPDQLEKVRAGLTDEGIGRMVEEIMRYTSVTEAGMCRFAREDIEIGGKVIKAGDGIIFHLPTANRDADVYEDPNTLDIERKGPRHVAFGWGVHQCVGQNLARAELKAAIPALVDAFPGIRLAVPEEELTFRENALVVGASTLPIAWD